MSLVIHEELRNYIIKAIELSNGNAIYSATQKENLEAEDKRDNNAIYSVTQRGKLEAEELKCGSITVTMTIVLFLIVSVLLVTLEHAYVNAGRTLALETLDKAMESVIGEYYAPLYATYGLMAVACADGNAFETEDDFVSAMAEMINYAIGTDDSNSSLWQMSLRECRVEKAANLMSDDGDIFLNQIKSQSVYDAALNVVDDLADFKGQDYKSIKEWYTKSKNTIDSSSSDSGDTESDDDEEAYLFKTLAAILEDGLSGLWFENAMLLSERTTGSNNLPSDDYGIYHTSCLYNGTAITVEEILEGDYLEDLFDLSFFSNFETMVDTLTDTVSDYITDKGCLVAYAGMNLDNYLCNNINGKLMYEQEYLIFGCDNDESNIKRMGWSIFGIRFAANLIYFTQNAEVQAELAAMIAEYATLSKVAAAALLVLLTVVLAVENAVVETAAILRGKSVDFIVSPLSQCIKVSEMLTFNKTTIDTKAKNYKGGISVKIGYQVYLYAFMSMIETRLLTYRLMDIVQLNMKKIYNKDFKLENCIVGFSARVELVIPDRFTNTSVFLFNRRGKYRCIVKSAVYMPGSY